MSTFILDERTSQTSVRDLLASDGDAVIEIRNTAGALLARVERSNGTGAETGAASPAADESTEPRADGDAAARFQRLAEQWKTESEFLSSTSDAAMHPAYQQIIGLGRAALPRILRELEHEPRQWFWALKAITGEDPVPPGDRGRVDRMSAVWLEWGRGRGLI